MAAYVRIRNQAEFKEFVRAHRESQVALASKCGLSAQRMSQLFTGVGPVVRASSAARIEDELGVARGYLFVADEPGLIKGFLGCHGVAETGEDEPAPTDPADADA